MSLKSLNITEVLYVDRWTDTEGYTDRQESDYISLKSLNIIYRRTDTNGHTDSKMI
jgi:hypothetical protein